MKRQQPKGGFWPFISLMIAVLLVLWALDVL